MAIMVKMTSNTHGSGFKASAICSKKHQRRVARSSSLWMRSAEHLPVQTAC